MSTATATPSVADRVKAAKEALAASQQNPAPEPEKGKGGDPVPADPTAGNNDPQPKLTDEEKKMARLFGEVIDHRKEFDNLLLKLPHEAAKKALEDAYRRAVPQLNHTLSQLVSMRDDLNQGCDVVGRLTKALQPQEVKKKDLLPPDRPTAQVQPPTEQPTPPAPQPTATPPAATNQPAQVQPATTTEPEWEALPLWAKWTIGGVGGAVITGVIAWVFYAIIGM